MKIVKKVFAVALGLILFANANAMATSNNPENDYYGTFKAEREYLKEKNVSSYQELSSRDKKELDDIIDKLKPVEGIRTRSSSGSWGLAYLPRDIIRDDETYYVYKWENQ